MKLSKIHDLQSQIDEGNLNNLRRTAGLTENVLTDSTGSTLQHILDTFKRDVRDFKETGEVSDELHNALYDYYFDDMPYGTKKARDGDPYEWVADRFGADLGIDGYGSNSPGLPDEDYGLERESVMHGDYAEEATEPHSVDGGMENPLIQDEGWKGQLAGGTVGTLAGMAAGAATPIPFGSAIGGALGGTAGQMIGDKLGGDEETDEGIVKDFSADTGEVVGDVAAAPVNIGKAAFDAAASSIADDSEEANESSPLAGQYGHSGKMKEVGKETSFLDRLKELSGMVGH
jgi:phage tail tape-measure protein